jgi:hypothetical protein
MQKQGEKNVEIDTDSRFMHQGKLLQIVSSS